jgi:Lamin Tail Domain
VFSLKRQRSSRTSIRRSFSIERLEDRFALDGRLAITELMYQPAAPNPPFVADDMEYIEVQNIGDATLNLGGMSFANGVQFTFPAVDLGPGQFAIIARNVDAFRSIYGNVPTVLGTFTNALSNGGERLTIERGGTFLVDFTYDGSWYDATAGQGFSLVPDDVNTTTLTPNDQLYWRPSAVAFGSPGSADAGGLDPGSVVINELLAHTDMDWAIGSS